MQFQENILAVFIMATMACVLICFGTASTENDLQQAIEQQLANEQFQQINSRNQLDSYQHDGYQHLKRKRRYLEFPEGSSFQLVYDLIIGVVDFTNYLILGITVALAWELPSKPPSEIFNDLSERLKDGSLGTSRNDTRDNIKYIDPKNESISVKAPVVKYKFIMKPMFRPPMHYQYYIPGVQNHYLKNSNNSYIRQRTSPQHKNYHLFYTRKPSHPFIKWAQDKKYPEFSAKGVAYPWWNLRERLKNSFVVRPSVRRFDKNIKPNRIFHKNKLPPGIHSTGRSEHRIYPVFGKRDVSAKPILNKNLFSAHMRYKRNGIATELPSKLDRIHIGHHRRTRHDLYQRIETYLNRRGSHGHHCVLKALCETGQKSSELKPGSFVGELMRAVFTIPEPLEKIGEQHISDKILRYDTANTFKQNCSRRYTRCKESLWSLHFVL